jgi:uncharacterized protein
MINVELIGIWPDQVWRQQYQVAVGTTAAQLLAQSQVGTWLKMQQIQPSAVGVYGHKIEPAEYMLADGDRVEVYRPLTRDPKDVRRVRADRHPVGRRRPNRS